MAHRLKLAVIGDPHLALPRGDPDRRLEVDPGRKLHGLSAELLQATIDEVNASPGIDAVLLLGDLTRDSELFNHEAALMLLKKINAPLYIILGNHDMLRQRPQGVSYPDEPHLDRHEVADMYRHCGLPGGKTRYVVELPGDVALVVLDSNRSLEELDAAGEDISRQDHGWVGGKQLGWLDEVLGRIRAGGRLSLVAVHHSVTDHSPAEQPGHLLHPLCEQWQLHDSSAARQCLARHRVPLVLSGHLHAQSFNVQDNVANLVTSATVSYPHAWRLLSITTDAIYIESRPLGSIPSVDGLQQSSRAWMAEGMGAMIEKHAASNRKLAGFAKELGEMITCSGWWPRFCDGTLAGFSMDEACIPKNSAGGMVFSQAQRVLDEFGEWKAARPDPNELEIPLKPYL